MDELHTVEVRFRGENVATHIDGADVFTLYRTPEGLYRVHIDEGELAWLEGGRTGAGLTEAQLRRVFPAFEGDTTRPGSRSPQGPRFPMSGDAGA